MAMMRRGPLDRYPVEWVLRQVGTHRASGTIELHTDRPATIFVDGGRITDARRGIWAEGDPGPEGSAPPDEGTGRRRALEVVADALVGEGGWYYHDPLGRSGEPPRGHWEPAVLLLEARAWTQERRSLGAWTDADVSLRGGIGPLAVGPDAWAVVVALATAVPAAEVLGRLGWTADRLLPALDELAGRGALVAPRVVAPTEPTPEPVASPDERRARGRPGAEASAAADAADAAVAVAAAEDVLASADVREADWPRRPAARPVPPTVMPLGGSPGPGPSPPGLDDRRGALRRLISSLRPA